MLAWKIALRYLFSKKSHGVVNVISIISVSGVAVATAAIIIVLSIFNGFTRLAASHLSILDPQVKITAAKGKTIVNADSLAEALRELPIVSEAIPIIEERGLLIFGNEQMPVMFKGVPQGYNTFTGIDSAMVEGIYAYGYEGNALAQISGGVAMRSGARSGGDNVISLYVPRRLGRINPANPAASFSGQDFSVSGIFQIGQSEYDADHIFIPIESARDLLQYTTEATSVDIELSPDTDAAKAIKEIKNAIGEGYLVLDRMEQQQEAFRMIQVEKWITFLLLAFILVIASFNIISTLSLLVIEKRFNMATLRALGAPQSMIRRIFIIEGWLISICGGMLGIILGTLLSLAQQHFGFIKLSADPNALTITSYPVEVQGSDLLMVMILVVIVGFLTSQMTRLFKTS